MSTQESQRDELVSGGATATAVTTDRLRVMRDGQRAANRAKAAESAVVAVNAGGPAQPQPDQPPRAEPPIDDRVVSFAQFMAEFELAYEAIVDGRSLMSALAASAAHQFVVGIEGCMLPVSALGLTADAEADLKGRLMAIAHDRLRASFRSMMNMTTLAYETMTREAGDVA